MSETAKRTRETEEFTNLYFIHPLSAKLVSRLVNTKITPNMVSLTGMIFGIVAGFAYYYYQTPSMAIAGFISMIIWHILDGADGQLARLTGKFSEAGKMLDGMCDYVAFASVYIGIGIMLSQQTHAAIWPVILVAGFCHALQSSAYELHRNEYDFWGYGKEGAALPEITRIVADIRGKSFFSSLLNRGYVGYVWVQRRISGIDRNFRRDLREALKNNPDKTTEIRALYREVFTPALKVWTVMSANYRTITIFIAAIAGQPIYFFWLEIVVLTPVLVLLIRRLRRSNRLFSLRLKEIL
ncbi:MAG: CDP-alcohol phosphatidyltransferase family protein [Alphaproteobacteria bacterium]|nr:CDP-alcohol phosphatidyltransferase family protein [Alphaproteobacteria bacterium]